MPYESSFTVVNNFTPQRHTHHKTLVNVTVAKAIATLGSCTLTQNLVQREQLQIYIHTYVYVYMYI